MTVSQHTLTCQTTQQDHRSPGRRAWSCAAMHLKCSSLLARRTTLLRSLKPDVAAALLLGKHDVAAQHVLHAAPHGAALVLQAGGAVPVQQRASDARLHARHHAAPGPCAQA